MTPLDKPSTSWRRALAIAAAGVTMVALLGGLATEIGPWYRALKKPLFQPPDWLFGPAWTVIFAMTAVAAADAWSAAPAAAARRNITAAFILNGLLNVLWSVLFFKLQRPDWARLEVVVLWLSIVGLIALVRPFSNRAAVLLAPYLAWVTFAAVLNHAVVQLNQPF
jgi:tryptophan-rich sensory protein